MLYHKTWFDHVEGVRDTLTLPVFSKDQEIKRLHVNLHTYVLQAIKEAETMLKLELDIPPFLKTLILVRERIMGHSYKVKTLVDRNNSLRLSIPGRLLALIRPQLKKLEKIFAPGLTQVTWASSSLDSYIVNVQNTLKEVEDFLFQITNIDKNRIELNLLDLGNTDFIELPNEPVRIDQLEEINSQYRVDVGKEFDCKLSL